MTRTITFLLATFFAISSFGQTFEGKIVYKNIYKSKMPNLADEQFTSMMGSTQEYFIKNGNYKSVTNGLFFRGNFIYRYAQLLAFRLDVIANPKENGFELFGKDVWLSPSQRTRFD